MTSVFHVFVHNETNSFLYLLEAGDGAVTTPWASGAQVAAGPRASVSVGVKPTSDDATSIFRVQIVAAPGLLGEVLASADVRSSGKPLTQVLSEQPFVSSLLEVPCILVPGRVFVPDMVSNGVVTATSQLRLQDDEIHLHVTPAAAATKPGTYTPWYFIAALVGLCVVLAVLAAILVFLRHVPAMPLPGSTPALDLEVRRASGHVG